MAHLDRATLHRIGRLQTRHDLAGGKNLNLELIVAGLGNCVGEGFPGSVNGVERFGKARGQSPPEFRHGLRNRRLGNGAHRGCQAGSPQELAAFHRSSLP